MPDIFGLVDCNNFYASCERLFLPSLQEKPVIVLSNNDGCVIARSREAKMLGIPMAVPAFEIEDLIRRNNVHVFSTNYTLYGDISERVMNILATCSPDMEIYSIDEAFVDLSHIPEDKLLNQTRGIIEKIGRYSGIPVSIGIGQTKTLAKAANYLAKANPSENVVLIPRHDDADGMLKRIPVNEIWGVGDQYLRFFKSLGIQTAFDLKLADEYRIREHLGVTGQRLVLELRGKACFGLNEYPEEKKEICTSRSFGRPLECLQDLEEATSSYAARVAAKLRKQNSMASAVLVFLMTNKYAQAPQYVNYRIATLSTPASDTPTILNHALKALRGIYRRGFQYKKSGIIATGLVPASGRQTCLWDQRKGFNDQLQETIDRINMKSGGEKVKYAIQGNGKSWKMRQNNLSPHYTTSWSDLPTVNIDKEFQ